MSKFLQAFLPISLACAIFSMQSVLPTGIPLRCWIYTLVGFFLLITLIVINIPRIATLIQFLRGWQDWYWGRLWEFVQNSGRREVSEEAEEDEGDEGFEMDDLQDGNGRDGSGSGEV